LFKFLLPARHLRRLAGPPGRHVIRRRLWGRWGDRFLSRTGRGWGCLWLRLWFRFRIDDRDHLNIHHLDLRLLLFFKEFGHNRLAFGFSLNCLGLLIHGRSGWRGDRLCRGPVLLGCIFQPLLAIIIEPTAGVGSSFWRIRPLGDIRDFRFRRRWGGFIRIAGLSLGRWNFPGLFGGLNFDSRRRIRGLRLRLSYLLGSDLSTGGVHILAR
jgi:hypothetical protein